LRDGYPGTGERIEGVKGENGRAGVAEMAEEKPGGEAGLATERGSDSRMPLARDT